MSQDKQEKKRQSSLSDWMIDRLDIPADVLSGGLRAELRGRHSLTVHGCKKIEEYTSNCIRLSVKKSMLCVRGCDLVCISYLAGAVGIEGRIDSLSFDDGTGGDRDI
ncbi:MAG: hypothetical protein E7589_00615 [Ruminococcaceae bacterium]|nr:hypothetical protein [Oscillospiraceae bacterium]